MLVQLATVLWIAGLTFGSASEEATEHGTPYGYDSGELEPKDWPTQYKTCKGKYQSPIDIEDSYVEKVNLPLLRFHNSDKVPMTTTLKNNGHTVVLELNYSTPVMISGGPFLARDYKFNHLHFHWGVNDSLGSEDLINNHSYPMELHMVFHNTDYDTFEEAKAHNDGLVVLAAFFEATDDDNIVYSKLINSLSNITMPNQTTELTYGFDFRSMLPESTQLYFTYKGSLTTPPCSEGVIWVDFKNPILLSHKQIQSFRGLHSSHGYLTHNARPVQELYGRPVLYNQGGLHMDSPNGAATHFGYAMSNIILLLSFKLVTLMLL